MGIPLPPPWVLMSFVLGFAGHLQDIKEIGGLGVAMVTGRGEDAGCKICDKLVGIILKQIDLDTEFYEAPNGEGMVHVECFLPWMNATAPRCLHCGEILGKVRLANLEYGRVILVQSSD